MDSRLLNGSLFCSSVDRIRRRLPRPNCLCFPEPFVNHSLQFTFQTAELPPLTENGVSALQQALRLKPRVGPEKGRERERNASLMMTDPGLEEDRERGRGELNEGNVEEGGRERERQTAWPLSSLGRLPDCSGKHRMWARRRGDTHTHTHFIPL